MTILSHNMTTALPSASGGASQGVLIRHNAIRPEQIVCPNTDTVCPK
jgi:hypothetical protein